MYVDPERGSDWNSGLTPDQPLCSIQAAIDKLPFLHEEHTLKYAEDRSRVITVFRSPPPVEKEEKKEYPKWPPEPDNLNEKWW